MTRVSTFLAAVAFAVPVTASTVTQYTNPYTGALLPPEPQHNGCLCSTHYKTDAAPKEPARPFRQGFDAPLVETVPDPLEPVK